jgi:SRSO17 transposase
LPANTSRRELVNTAKLRWRIERDYQERKQELGLGHFEGEVGAASIITPRSASPPTDP